jgi:NADH:ubiquinone oxidoreductase subunit D
VGINGDSHDRMLIFFEECRQSIKILNQLLENLPIGEFQSDSSLVALLNKPDISALEWRQTVSGAQRVWSSQYTAIEGANGELGFHLVLHPETINVYGFKIKSNALLLSNSLDLFLNQCPVVDLSATLASLDINSSFLDR